MHRRHFALLAAALALMSQTRPGHAQEAGEAVFKKNCAVCHSTEAGQNKIGPSLAGVFGRKAGSAPNFMYSNANKNSSVTWDETTLDAYLASPTQFMPGTKMVFAGVKNPDDRKAVIAYLKTLK